MTRASPALKDSSSLQSAKPRPAPSALLARPRSLPPPCPLPTACACRVPLMASKASAIFVQGAPPNSLLGPGLVTRARRAQWPPTTVLLYAFPVRGDITRKTACSACPALPEPTLTSQGAQHAHRALPTPSRASTVALCAGPARSRHSAMKARPSATTAMATCCSSAGSACAPVPTPPLVTTSRPSSSL